ncbi:hypothetical protein ACH5RR_033738 [Cinchona calisaya]|uniref:Uncharacterized protein n=1 Tax=Cinchona calisaya TaxID=153742 RepID=A0ABD2YDG0_9GENT
MRLRITMSTRRIEMHAISELQNYKEPRIKLLEDHCRGKGYQEERAHPMSLAKGRTEDFLAAMKVSSYYLFNTARCQQEF